MERDGSANYGIQQSGGSSHVGNQAVGPGAYAVGGTSWSVQGASGDIGDLLRRVEELLDRHGGELPEQARVTVGELRAELTGGRAQPGAVTRLVERLALLAAPVAPVAVAVGELARVINATMGR